MPVPIDDLIKIKNAADSAKIQKEHIALLKVDTATLGQRIRELALSRDQYKKADSLSTEIARLKDREIIENQGKTKIAMDAVAELNKKLTKQRRRTRLVGISGTLTTIAGVIITTIIKK